MTENCENCAFGQAPYGGFDYKCRRHAPKASMTEMGVRPLWPPVQPTDFCGDFELKDAKG